MEPGQFLRNLASRPPGKPLGVRVRLPLHHVCGDLAQHRRELERVPAAAGGDEQPPGLRVRRDVEVPVPGIVVEAGTASGQGLGRQLRHRVGQEPLAVFHHRRVGVPGVVGVGQSSRSVVRQLHHPFRVGRKTVPPGTRYVRSPGRKVRRPELVGDARTQVHQCLRHRRHHVRHLRHQSRRPNTGGHHHDVCAHLFSIGSPETDSPPRLHRHRLCLETRPHFNPRLGRFRRHERHRFPGLCPAASGVEVSVDVVFRVPEREPLRHRLRVHPFQRPPSGSEQIVRLPLDRSRFQRLAGQHQEPVLVVEQAARPVVPHMPLGDGLRPQVAV